MYKYKLIMFHKKMCVMISPKERESAGTALENSNGAVAIPASLSFVSEAHDNQARSYYQSTGECFSLSWGLIITHIFL